MASQAPPPPAATATAPPHSQSDDPEKDAASAGAPDDTPDVEIEKAAGGRQDGAAAAAPPADDVLTWDGPDDPDNPQNWPPFKRRVQVICIAFYTLLANLTATMFAPGVQDLLLEFNSDSETIGSLAVSIYILGFGIGPLLFSPLSERYGRLPIYASSAVLFAAFLLGSAFATNMGMFIAFRFLCGAGSSASLSMSGGTLADVIAPQHRAVWMSAFVLPPFLGPVVGPIAGGFIAQNLGWRWTFRIILILCAVLLVFCVAFLRETFAPVILRRRAARRAKEQGLPAKVREPLSAMETVGRVANTVARPLRLLALSPIVLFLSLYGAFAFGLLFLLFTSFAIVFKGQYGWSTGISGLAYLGLGIGMLGSVLAQNYAGPRILAAQKRKNGRNRPEDRLLITAYVAPLLPAGMFWYGWCVDKQTHWIVPIIATVLVGVAIVCVLMPQMIYLVEVYGAAAGASALAANIVLRSIAGAFLPLAGPPLYASLGLGWGNSLLAFLALAFIPIPWVLALYGERLRESSKFIL